MCKVLFSIFSTCETDQCGRLKSVKRNLMSLFSAFEPFCFLNKTLSLLNLEGNRKGRQSCLEDGLRRNNDNTQNPFIVMMSLGLQSNRGGTGSSPWGCKESDMTEQLNTSVFQVIAFNYRLGRSHAKSHCQKLVVLKICFSCITIIIMNRNTSDKNQSELHEHPKFSLWEGV